MAAKIKETAWLLLSCVSDDTCHAAHLHSSFELVLPAPILPVHHKFFPANPHQVSLSLLTQLPLP